jgi:hypothetical protein
MAEGLLAEMEDVADAEAEAEEIETVSTCFK